MIMLYLYNLLQVNYVSKIRPKEGISFWPWRSLRAMWAGTPFSALHNESYHPSKNFPFYPANALGFD